MTVYSWWDDGRDMSFVMRKKTITDDLLQLMLFILLKRCWTTGTMLCDVEDHLIKLII